MKSYDSLKKAKTLREKAEDLLKIKASASNLPDDVISNLIHDIEVHEVELDMQNEELNKAKIRAEIAAEKYTELYDFAPFGYCTLTKEGRISELNFNAAKLLNKERSLLKKALFSLYVTIESRPTYKHFLEKVFSSHSKQSCEINIKFENHNIKTISFTGISNENGDHCLLTLMDITERKQVEEELRSSHELLHQHIKNSPIYTFIKEVTEKESKVLFASENFIDMIGIPGSEMIGRTMFELFPPNLAAKFTVDDWEVISSNRTIEYEENLNERSYHTIKFPIRSGNKTLLAGYNIDITYNKEAEKKLAEKRHRLAVILQGTNVGTWEWNIQTGETYFNERWAEIIGYTLEELSPISINTWHDNIHPKDKNKSKHLLKLHFDGDIVHYECEVRMKHKNGDWVWVLDQGKVHERDDEGRPLMMSGTHTDITKRKLAEFELEESNEKYRGLVEMAVDGILVSHRDQTIIDANTCICEMFGKSKIDIINQPLRQLIFAPNMREQAPFQFERLKKGEVIITERDIVRRDGSLISVEVLTKMLPNNTYQSIFRDVSNRIRLLKEINKINATLEAQVNERTAELTESNEALHQTRINYETFFNTIDDFLFVLDKQASILHVNTTISRRLGYSINELLGKSVIKLHPANRRNEATQIIKEMLKGVRDFCQVPLITKSGVLIPVETRVSKGLWNGQEVIFGVSKDISQIQFSEEKFSKVFHINPSACGLSDAKTHQYIEVNDEFTSLFGFSKDEVIGKTAIELGIMTPESLNLLMKQLDSKGKIVNAETELRTKNGTIKTVTLSAENIIVQDKTYRYTVVHDITEEKENARALKLSEQKYRTLFENLQDVFVSTDLDGIIIEISPSIEQLLGYSRKEILGKSISKLYYYPYERNTLVDELKIVKELRDFELIAKTKAGLQRYISINVRLVYDSNGDPTQIEGIVRNINDRKIIENELKESQAKYQFIVENTDDILWTMNPDFSFDYVSPSVFKFLGYTVEEHLQQTISDFMTPQSVQLINEEFNRGVINFKTKQYHKLRESVNLEIELIRKDKSQLHANISLFILRDEDHQITKIRGITSDITQRKIAEETIKETAKQLSKAQEMSHLGSWELHIPSDHFIWSDEVYDIFGLTPNEIEPNFKSFLRIIHPEDRKKVKQAFTNSLLLRKNGYEIEHRIVRKHSGEVRYVFEKCEHTKNDKGEIVLSVGLIQDITERKMAEKALMESESALSKAQEIAHIGNWELNELTYELKWSDEIFRIMGLEPQSKTPTWELFVQHIHPEDRHNMVDGINAAWISQSDFSTDHRIVLPSGLERIVHEQAQIGYSEKGIPIKWIGTMQDITQAKLAENKLFNITAEVEERERNRFARDLHDGLGPVLSTVKLYFQWLAEANKDESATIIIEKGNKSIDTAIQTAREVSQGLSLQSLNKSGFALTLLEFTKTINTTKKIDIKFTYNSKNRFNSMLETTLYRITTELINNTLKYAKAKNVEIEFNYSKEKNKITLLYTDNGKGFNVAKVEKTNKGLGLMNIKQRIRIIKGSISIDSERKKGTKVMIEIPLS